MRKTGGGGHKKRATTFVIALFNQCGRRDLNPHARNEHKILSLARLPVPTLPQELF